MAIEANGGHRLAPRDATDVEEILRTHTGAIEPLGGGSKRAVGPPVDADVLDLSALAGVLDYEPAELVLTARAATPLGEIERELARHGQRLAFEPPDFGGLLGCADGRAEQTIGGVLSANLAGSRRIAAGAARDHFLGFSAVTGDGTSFKAGGRVVKNVTGYDLPKLLAGAWGTLAVLTEVTVRVAPAAETEATLVLRADAAEEAVALLTRALASPHDVSSAAFDPERGCAVRVEGFETSVEARVRAVLDALGRPDAERLTGDTSRGFWKRIGDAAPLEGSAFVVRLSVPPSAAPRVLSAIAPERYLLDWGGGLVWAAYTELDAARVDAIRATIGEGHATLWKAPRSARETISVFPPLQGAAAIMARRLKAALDPKGRLNPGRMGGAAPRT